MHPKAFIDSWRHEFVDKSLRWLWLGVLLLGAQACGPEKKICQSDQECSGGQVCKEGACTTSPPPPSGCTKDSDCKADESCTESKCVAKAQTCTETSCGKDETCFQGQRCLKPPVPCKTNGECGTGALCIGEDNNTTCAVQCDATTANADKTHPACWGGWGHCEPLSAANPERGVCVPPRTQTQKSGEDCKASDYTKASYHDCLKELRCIEGKCLPNCDPTKGTSTNLVCPDGTFCKGDKGVGLCEKLPEAQQGPKQLDETCSTRTAANFCDGNKGLVCVNFRCTKACDPRKGKDNNPKCGPDDECIEETDTSALGGQCLHKPTQKKGEECSNIDQLKCLEGLNCSGGRCATACDPAKTGECGSGEACSRLGNVCVTTCDPDKGTTTNATCEVGWYCGQSSSTPPGYCRSLPNFDQGMVGLGEACTGIGNDKNCDGSKKLFCYRNTCFQACDPRKSNPHPDCKTDEECTETTQSPLGGTCLPKATQQENDLCDETNKRCIGALRCSFDRCSRACTGTTPQSPDCKAEEWCFGGTCRAKCDPADGEVGNKACPQSFACIKSETTYKPGYCRPLPSPPTSGPKKYGEACSQIDDKEACDTSANLLCRQGNCVKACDPSKGKDNNTDCDSGQTCDTQLNSSFLGGICVTTPTQQENDLCNTTDKLCIDGLACAPLDGVSYCLKLCDPRKTDDCKAGVTCKSVGTGRNACVPTRNNTRNLHESCKGTPSSPAFDDCGPDLLCVRLLDATGESYCLPACAPPKTCAEKTVCVADPTGLRVCAQECLVDADCKDYGTTCKDTGSQKICI